MILDIEKVLYTVSQALLGEVSCSLRAVSVSSMENHVHFDCFFDGQVNDCEIERMSCVEAEVYAALPESFNVTHSVHRMDSPTLLPRTNRFAYFRRE